MDVASSAFHLEDKVAIVTGASQGIGRAIALGLARHGAHIVLVGLNEERMAHVRCEIEELGRRALAVRADLVSVEQIRAMADRWATRATRTRAKRTTTTRAGSRACPRAAARRARARSR